MGVGDEVLEPVGGEHLLDPGPDPAHAAALAPGRRRPLVPRPICALREPDAAGGPAEMATVRLDGGAELEVDGLVAAEEREVAVGRGAGDHLDVAAALELGEGAGDVAADPAVHLPPISHRQAQQCRCEVRADRRRRRLQRFIGPLRHGASFAPAGFALAVGYFHEHERRPLARGARASGGEAERGGHRQADREDLDAPDRSHRPSAPCAARPAT